MGLFGFGKKKKDSENEKKSSEAVNEVKATPDGQEELKAESEDTKDSADSSPVENDEVSENVTAVDSGTGDESDDSENEVSGEDYSDAYNYYLMGVESRESGDEAAAFQYFAQAAELGYSSAQFEMGLIYENGNEVQEPDREEAAKWYRKAAEQDDAAAQFNLGYMYYNNPSKDGKEKEEGLEWIRKAADGGDEAAKEFLESIEKVKEKEAHEKEMRVKRRGLIRQLMGRNELFITYSTLTKHPFIENEGEISRVYIFSSEISAHSKAKELTQAGQPSTTYRYYKKDFLALIGELYTMGVNSIRVDDGGTEYDAYLYEVAKPRDTSGLPASRRPLQNPKLQNSMLAYMQEFRRKVDEPDKAFRRRLDQTMVENMTEGMYLFIFRKGEGEDEGRTQFIVMNNDKTGDSWIPVFTDNIEYGRFRSRLKISDNDISLRISPFDMLADMKLPGNTRGYMINPMSLAVPLPQDYVKKVNEQRKNRQIKV